MKYWEDQSAIYGSGLEDNFVFYERLKQDGEENPRLRNLYTHINGRLSSIELNMRDNPAPIIQELKTQAAHERQKEVQALNKAWGVTIDPNLTKGKDFYKNLIEALTVKLNSQKIFERNKARLLYTGKTGKSKGVGKIDVSKFLGFYFPKAFADAAPIIESEIANRTKGLNVEEAAKESLQKHMREILKEALKAMYSSETFNPEWEKVGNNAEINDETRGAYQEIIDSLEDFREKGTTGNWLLEQIYKTYQFDRLIQELSQYFAKQKKPVAKRTWDIKKINQVTVNQSTAGILAELQETALINFANKLQGGDLEVMHTGKINNQKSDFTVGYQIDLNEFYDQWWMEVANLTSETDSVRLQNILAANEATQWLENNTTGYNFIMYVNAKNYDINSNFQGFKSGSDVAMKDLGEVIAQIPSMSYLAADTLIGALLQFGAGAIGTDTQREAILNSLAGAMAYFLFDDFASLVSEGNENGVNAIHLFWLSGFYIPLSFFLEVSADAIKEGWEKTDDYFRFKLKSPNIKYGDTPLSEYTSEMWATQREEALNQTTLTFTFLSSFQSLMAAQLR